jgi:hypothetical protein
VSLNESEEGFSHPCSFLQKARRGFAIYSKASKLSLGMGVDAGESNDSYALRPLKLSQLKHPT